MSTPPKCRIVNTALVLRLGSNLYRLFQFRTSTPVQGLSKGGRHDALILWMRVWSV
jgi:hypothetical protein